MKKKKMIIMAVGLLLVIAAVIIVFILTNRGTKEEGEDFLPEEWQSDAGKLSETTLTFYINGKKQIVHEEILEAVNLKLGNELNAKLDFKFYWEYYDNFLDRIRRDNASGTSCDAFFYTPEIKVPINTLVQEGLIQDVTETFPRYAPGYYNQFNKDDIKAMKVNGGIYIVPSRMPSADMKCALVRQDLMEKYNIPEIHSYDDFEVYLDAITKNEKDMIPLRYRNTSMWLFADLYGYVALDHNPGLVYKWDDPSMKIVAWEQTPEFPKSLERLQKWNDNGYMGDKGTLEGVLGIFDADMSCEYDLFVADGKSASFIANPSEEAHFNTLLESKGITDISYRAYPLYEGYSVRNPITESGIVINAKSRNTERVLMFIDWLQSEEENYDLLMYGKEGTHYIDMGGYIESPADATTTFLEWTWKTPFENIDRQRNNNPELNKALARYTNMINSSTKYPPHSGFIPDYSSVETIYNSRWFGHMRPENLIYNGIFPDDDEMDEIIEEQKALGVDNLVAEIQNQLNEYLAKYGEK